nr:MAG TPA: hypothetical protein [Caudoviricetes sp.]
MLKKSIKIQTNLRIEKVEICTNPEKLTVNLSKA